MLPLHFLVLETTANSLKQCVTNFLICISICICEQVFFRLSIRNGIAAPSGLCVCCLLSTKAMAEAPGFGAERQQKFWFSVTQSQHCRLGCLSSAGPFLEPPHRGVWAPFFGVWLPRLTSWALLRFWALLITIHKILAQFLLFTTANL